MHDFAIVSKWLDKILSQELPKGIVAFNFNIYEGSNGTYDVQLIGSDEFDENDEDWACSDYYSSGEDICYIKRIKEIEQWEQGLSFITKLVEQYLIEGRNADSLKSACVIGIGFVDGDIGIIYRSE
ncbi:hypothetical protein [Sporomusa aerivorans]|uniref:hypothetical protein n=1 Tax=Sporomusa aerivorans TaxID=204936 RepID=UPI00352A51E8